MHTIFKFETLVFLLESHNLDGLARSDNDLGELE